jgi:hypothetical protein
MPRVARQGPPVRWTEFTDLLEYLQANETAVKDALRRVTRQHQIVAPSFELLGHIASLWKKQVTQKPFCLGIKDFDGYGGAGTIKQLISYANKYLKIASEKGHLDRPMTPWLTAGGGEVSFVWVKKEEEIVPEDRERRFDRVYYLYREWRNTAQDDLFRGFTAMAEALGIEAVLHRFQSREAIAAEVLRIVERHRREDHSPKPISIVMALEDEEAIETSDDIDRARELAEGRLFLTRTEYVNAQVQQDCELIGKRIAQCMARDLAGAVKKKPRRNKVLLVDAELGDLSSFQARKRHFRRSIARAGEGLEAYARPVRITKHEFYSSGVAEKVRAETAKILAEDKDREIVAIYTGYFSLTWGAIMAARESGRTPEEFSIYSEDIVYALIRELGNPAAHLKATCGVDPYHYGRYLLRVAATRAQDDRTERAPAPEPFVLTKSDVTYGDCGKIGYTHELDSRKLSFHEGDGHAIDIRLDGERYAWKHWMRQCLPLAYGPALLKSRRSTCGRE